MFRNELPVPFYQRGAGLLPLQVVRYQLQSSAPRPRPPLRQPTSMGNLIWHEYSRYVSITASCYAVWAGFFGLIYRKFFWDFVGGTLRDPGGLQPSPNAAIFITLIVKMPVIQIISMTIGLFMIAVEFPLPPLKKLAIHRSIVFRVVVLFMQTFFAILFYQGTNAALWSLIAAGCYIRALMLGEKMEEAKNNRGKGGRA